MLRKLFRNRKGQGLVEYGLIIAGVAYVAHSITSLLLAGHRIVLYEQVTMLMRAAGEFPVMLWLLIKGADVRPAADA